MLLRGERRIFERNKTETEVFLLNPEKRLSKKILASIKLLRPMNCIMMGFAVLIGELIALKGYLEFFPSMLGFVTAFTLTGSSMAINDYFDRFVDAVNEPTRPIPSGLIEPKKALGFAVFLGFVGLLSAFLTCLYAFFIAILFYSISAFYNAQGKKYGLPGNLMVSGCIAVPFIYGALIVGIPLETLLLICASAAFFSNTGREIIKGIADVEGDRLRGVKTLAISLNPKKAAKIAALFYFVAIGLVILPPIFRLTSILYLPFAAVACGGSFATIISVVKNPSEENSRRMKNLLLMWFGFGLLAFTLGAIPFG